MNMHKTPRLLYKYSWCIRSIKRGSVNYIVIGKNDIKYTFKSLLNTTKSKLTINRFKKHAHR